MLRVLIDSHHTRVLIDSYHTMPKPVPDKIHHFWISSNDYFTKQVHLFLNQKLFGCYISMIIYIQNHMSFFSVANFRVSPQASQYQKNSSYDGASICPCKMAGPFEMPILDRRKKNWLLGRGLVRKSSSME